ncbi:MAG: hypothetical protein IKA22_09845 [Lentisphaeria bacterium]|nr:hypothetical protein [Lentisphaeria bacterium]
MENPKKKLLFPEDVALIIWFCVTLFGTVAVAVVNAIWSGCKFGFWDVTGQWISVLLLFLIQSFTARIIGDCYAKSEVKKERLILIIFGILHSLLILADMSLFTPLLEYCSFYFLPVLSVILFLATGVYMIVLHQLWRGIVVMLFALPAFFQPVLVMGAQQ